MRYTRQYTLEIQLHTMTTTIIRKIQAGKFFTLKKSFLEKCDDKLSDLSNFHITNHVDGNQPQAEIKTFRYQKNSTNDLTSTHNEISRISLIKQDTVSHSNDYYVSSRLQYNKNTNEDPIPKSQDGHSSNRKTLSNRQKFLELCATNTDIDDNISSCLAKSEYLDKRQIKSVIFSPKAVEDNINNKENICIQGLSSTSRYNNKDKDNCIKEETQKNSTKENVSVIDPI